MANMQNMNKDTALRLAEILEGGYSLAWLYEHGGYEVSAELRRQHALIAALEAQLEAVGAGGVGPLIAGAGFSAAEPENIRGILARCRDFIDTTKAPAYPAGADLADEIDVLLAAPTAQADTNTASGAADLPEALINIAREIEALKRDCGMDPESAIAIQNGRYMAISYKVRALAAGQATAAQRGVAYAALPEPLEIDWPELHSQALGCGVEDRDLHNRYECAEYGWQDGADKCAERVPEQIFDADQMLAFADATCALRPSHGQAYPTIGDLCARIKAADDAAADRDYMLDSNDCIAVLRGEWKGPLTMDKPERASHGQAPAPADSVPAAEREQERIAFKAWGRPMFKHSNIEASWLGWIARASRGKAPAGANENAKLVTLIAECRDAFPIPAHGDPIENYWSAAIEDPANVPAYLQEIAKRKQADSVQDDSARLDWLLLRVSGAEFRRIGVHYSGNARRADVDAARKQGASHDR